MAEVMDANGAQARARTTAAIANRTSTTDERLGDGVDKMRGMIATRRFDGPTVKLSFGRH
jgi:hypothetical protein